MPTIALLRARLTLLHVTAGRLWIKCLEFDTDELGVVELDAYLYHALTADAVVLDVLDQAIGELEHDRMT